MSLLSYLDGCGASHDELGELFDGQGKVKPGLSGLDHQPDEPVAAGLLLALLQGRVRLGPHVSQLDGFSLQVGHQVTNLQAKQGCIKINVFIISRSRVDKS